jgi:hypothetical protein
MLLFCLVATASGGDDRLEKKKDRTLTGSWNLTTVLFDKELHAMVTFFEDGTFIHTGASTNNVNAHGIWKRIGSRTFYEENREYVYQNSELALFADTKEVIELSKDGMTLVGEAKTELKTLDGTVVDVVDFTIYGTRMTFGR